MSLFRRTPQELQRTSTIRVSNHAIAVHWWIYRWHYLEGRRLALEERRNVDPSARQGAEQRASQAVMKVVPLEDRRTFDAHFDAVLGRITHAAGPGADPDQIEADAIARLIAEAEGTTSDSDSFGYVPESGGKWYDVKPIPTTDPRLQAPKRTGRVSPKHAALAFAVLIAGLASTWSMLPDAPSTEVQAAQPTPRPGATPTPFAAISDDATEAIRPTSLELHRGDRVVALPIDHSKGAMGGAWSPDLVPGRVAWLEGTVVNLALCLAPADRELVTGVEAGQRITLRIANGDLRHYTASAPRTISRQQREAFDQRRVGLTLIVCGVPGNDRTMVEAALPAAPTP